MTNETEPTTTSSTAEPPKPPRGTKRTAKAPAIAATKPDTVPADGSPARAIYDAVMADEEIAPYVARPGDFATRVLAMPAFVNVPLDVLVERVHDAGMFASSGRMKNPIKDGRAWLVNQFKMAATKYFSQPKFSPSACAASAQYARPVPTSPRLVAPFPERVIEFEADGTPKGTNAFEAYDRAHAAGLI